VRSGSKAGEPSLPHCNLVRPDHHTSQSQIVGGQAQIQWEDRVDLWLRAEGLGYTVTVSCGSALLPSPRVHSAAPCWESEAPWIFPTEEGSSGTLCSYLDFPFLI
jgi:hypothetical protein